MKFLQCYHLDTCYLMAYLKLASTDDQVRRASEVVHRLLSKQYIIRFSQVALGEFIDVLTKEGLHVTLGDLLDFLNPSRGFEVFRLDRRGIGRFTDLVNMIKRKDRYIEPTDVLILAYSIADRDCRGLLTFERKLIDSKSLKDLIGKHAQDRKRFTITDYPRV